MTVVGDRVRLIRCNDPYANLKPGEYGTVTLIDAVGTVFVDWDRGGSLGLVSRGGDQWEVLPKEAA